MNWKLILALSFWFLVFSSIAQPLVMASDSELQETSASDTQLEFSPEQENQSLIISDPEAALDNHPELRELWDKQRYFFATFQWIEKTLGEVENALAAPDNLDLDNLVDVVRLRAENFENKFFDLFQTLETMDGLPALVVENGEARWVRVDGQIDDDAKAWGENLLSKSYQLVDKLRALRENLSQGTINEVLGHTAAMRELIGMVPSGDTVVIRDLWFEHLDKGSWRRTTWAKPKESVRVWIRLQNTDWLARGRTWIEKYWQGSYVSTWIYELPGFGYTGDFKIQEMTAPNYPGYYKFSAEGRWEAWSCFFCWPVKVGEGTIPRTERTLQVRNSAPTSDAQPVKPEVPKPWGTTFTYSTLITDDDGNRVKVTLYKDGSPYGSRWVSGSGLAIWTWTSTSDDLGDHNYFFVLTDFYDTTRDPKTGAYSGPTVTRHATGLSMSASATEIRTGQSVTFSGQLRDTTANKSLGGKGVRLERRDPGSTTWMNCGINYTTDSGNYSITFTPTKTYYYRAKFEGDSLYYVSTSSEILVTVPVFNFSLASSNVTVPRGHSASTTVTVTLNSGSTQNVNLTGNWVGGAPTGISNISFSRKSGNPTYTSTLTFTAAKYASYGSFTYRVTGSSGDLTGTVDITVTIMDIIDLAVILAEPYGVPHDSAHDSSYYETNLLERMQDYYEEVSYGTTAFRWEIYDNRGSWYKLPEDTWPYTGDTYSFIDNALTAADDDINYAQYDVIIAVFAGRSCSETNDFSSLPMFMTSHTFNTNEGEVNKSIQVSETALVGPWAHEMGHALGQHLKGTPLQELYDIVGKSDNWALMMGWDGGAATGDQPGSRPVHLCSFSKVFLGWLQYQNVNLGWQVTIESLPTMSQGDDVYRYRYWDDVHGLWVYFILEARTNQERYSDWDVEVPGTGLVIYKVGEDNVNWSGHIWDSVNVVDSPSRFYTVGEYYSDLEAGVRFTVTGDVQLPTAYKMTVSVEKESTTEMVGASTLYSPTAQTPENFYTFVPWAPVPDIDLHAYTADNMHVGMNYDTGNYEVEIPGAVVSGDLQGGIEWIFVPSNIEVYFSVTGENLESLGEEGAKYQLAIMYYDENGNRYNSPLTIDRITVGKVINYGYEITQNPDGTYSVVVISDNVPPTSSTNPIQPYWRNQLPVAITATASDLAQLGNVPSGVENVALWYRYSADNSIWGPWSEFDFDNEEPWNWEFDAPEGDGYYEFYTLATDKAGNIEAAPENADAKVGVDTVPPESSVDPISPYWQNSGMTPFEVTATASDDISGATSVEILYRYSSDNFTWDDWASFSVDTEEPWSWPFDAPEGDGYYEFYSVATDGAGNIEGELGAPEQYFEDFEDTAGMTVVGGSWYYSGGTYVMSGESGMNGISYSTEIPETTCDEVSFKFKLTSSSAWQYAGLLTRYDPATNTGILVYINQTTWDPEAEIYIQDFINGKVSNWGRVEFSKISWEVWHELKITASGETYTVYIDGEEKLEWTSAQVLGSGRVGLWSYRGSPVYFDNLKVTAGGAEEIEADARCGVDAAPPESSINPISPYWQNASMVPFEVLATASDNLSGIANVELYYRYSVDNTTWDAWTSYGIDNEEPWSWTFDAPEGDGYYEFCTVATDVALNTEPVPDQADINLGVDTTPTISSVDPIEPYWQESTSFTLSVTALDALSGVADVELYYQSSIDNVNWGEWKLFGIDNVALYEWSFTAPDGYALYQFYSVTTDVAGNVENAPETADATCCTVIPAEIDIDPDTLNLKSQGRWITAYIELPGVYDLVSIDLATITLEGVVPTELHPTEIGDHDGDGIPDLMIKFDRSAVQSLVSVGEAEIVITGKWHAVLFKGSDTIRVIEPGREQRGNRPAVPPGQSDEHPGKRFETPPGQSGEHPSQGQGETGGGQGKTKDKDKGRD